MNCKQAKRLRAQARNLFLFRPLVQKYATRMEMLEIRIPLTARYPAGSYRPMYKLLKRNYLMGLRHAA